MVKQVHGMLMLPARPAEVLEAVQIATEVRNLTKATWAAQIILQVVVNLNINGKYYSIIKT